jgi:Flp pilus assembly protein TadB
MHAEGGGPLCDTDTQRQGLRLSAPGEDEHAELKRLRAEVTESRERQASQPPRRRIGWRTPVATLLIKFGCLLAPVSVLGVWSAKTTVAVVVIVMLLVLIELIGRPAARPQIADQP